MEQVKLNWFVQLITCRWATECPCCKKCYKKSTVSEELYEMGWDRTERALDIRNLVKSQEVLKSLMHLVVPQKEKRKLLRLQRRALVLEPDCSTDSSEDDFFRHRSYFRALQSRYKFYDEDKNGDES